MTGRTYQYVSQLPYVADLSSLRRNTGRMIDWDQVPDSFRTDYATATITSNGGAAANATTLPVDALPVAVPSGTVLYFGVSKEFALTTAYAAAGATSLTVQALPTAISDGDAATLALPSSGAKVLPAGKIMAEVASGMIIPREVSGATEATCILESGANSIEPSVVGYGCIVGGLIFDNLLPDAAAGSFATWEGELVSNGMGFVFETYADNREV